MNKADKSIDTSKLPEEQPFIRKELDQHPQPPQPSKPLDQKYPAQDNDLHNNKETEKTSKNEGLNQENAPIGSDAFEGFEKADASPKTKD